VGSYKIYQVYFDEKSRENVRETPLEGTVNPLFENEAIVRWANHWIESSEHVGILSHKFFKDTLNKELVPITKEYIDAQEFDTDVIGFCSHLKDEFRMFAHAEKVHKGIDVIYRELFKAIGHEYDPNMKMRFVVYRNHFLARTEVYKRYVDELLIPCMNAMSDTSNEVLYNAIWQDSKYPYTQKRFREHPGLQERFVEAMGINYYPFHPFVLERMFSYWLNLNPEITCKHI